jgi:chemotaxis signal transduction protein
MNTGADIRAQEPGEAAVLRRRAEQLALVPQAPGAADVEALEFSVAGQRCLLELAWLQEVRPLQDLLPVPLAPGALLGVAQLRGRLLAVLDLAALLGVEAGREPATRLLVLGHAAPVFAVAAGEVHGLRRLPPQDAERRSQPLEGLRPEIVRAVTAQGQLLLDGARLLTLHGPARAQGLAEHPERSQPTPCTDT